jgi:hypothetical protein
MPRILCGRSIADHVVNERQGMRHLTASIQWDLRPRAIPYNFAQPVADIVQRGLRTRNILRRCDLGC